MTWPEPEVPPVGLPGERSLKTLKSLKKQLTEARAARAAAAANAAEPLEWGRILTEADFDRIKCAAPLLTRMHT